MNLARRREPFEPMGMSRLFQEMLRDPFADFGMESESEPLPLDIAEREDELIVRASLPGFRKEEVDVEVHNGMLSIRGEHREEHEERGERYHRRERRFGAVGRILPLPVDVDADQCRAELKEGVLTLHLPKTPESRPRRIQIAEGASRGGGTETGGGSRPRGAGPASGPAGGPAGQAGR